MTTYSTPNHPNAAKLIDSLRHLGYNNYSAICDLIDNALDAEAKNVWVNISQEARNPVIRIADDGVGMSERVLDEALKLGSNTERNSAADLGKFGMGLVTASLSIAKKTDVLTRCNGTLFASTTDVDEIRRRNEFCKFLGKAPDDGLQKFSEFLKNGTGTLVELTKCDNLKNQNLTVFKNTLKGKVAQVYRHFLLAGKVIHINGEPVKPRDPLMLDEGSEIFSDEFIEVSWTPPQGSEVREKIRIRIAFLPDFGADGNTTRKIGQSGQGFYILRNNREIADAQTLDLFTRHNDYNRFRAEIFFSGILDEAMGVNFTKHQIDPHQSVKDKLNEVTAGQLRTIRNRAKAARVTSENAEITHEEAEKIISSKSHLLIKPKPTKKDAEGTEAELAGTEKREGSAHTPRALPSAKPKASVKFEAVKLGVAGPIYEAEQAGRVIVIQWNVDHPFYQRFVLERKDDQTLRTSVDFLVYSLATAELTTLNEDNYEMIQNIKTVMSANLRSLLS